MAEAIVQVIFQGRILETVRLDKEINTIGRMPDNDVVINNLGISRQHCRIIQDEKEQFYVEDSGSANGTTINGVRVTRSPVYDGDEIQLGKHKLVFQLTTRGVAGFFKSEEDGGQDLWVGDRTIFTGTAPPQPPAPPPELPAPPVPPTKDTPPLDFSEEDTPQPVSLVEDIPQLAPAEEVDPLEGFKSELEGSEYGIKVVFDDKVIDVKGLGEEEVTIGRDADNGIVIDNLAVSRRHASITRQETQYVVEDLGSANGIRINGVILKRSPLYQGDEVMVGKHVLVFDTTERLLSGVSSREVGRVAQGEGWQTGTLPVMEPRLEAPPESAEEVEEERAPWEGKYAVRVELDGRAIGTYALTKRTTCIGRLAENDIVIDNIGVSRLHAKIIIEENGQVHIEDQDSANGMKVNGLPLERSPLYPGDTAQIAKHHLVFELAHKTQPQKEAAGGKMTTEAWRLDSTFMVSEDEQKQKLKDWAQRAHREKAYRGAEKPPEQAQPASPPVSDYDEPTPPSQPVSQPGSQAPAPGGEMPSRKEVSPYDPTPSPGAIPIKAKLVFEDGSAREIEAGEFVMGKGEGVDLQVEGVWIKKRHAIIKHEGGMVWRITAYGWLARVKVNGQSARSTVLKHDDEISLGAVRCKFEIAQ